MCVYVCCGQIKAHARNVTYLAERHVEALVRLVGRTRGRDERGVLQGGEQACVCVCVCVCVC